MRNKTYSLTFNVEENNDDKQCNEKERKREYNEREILRELSKNSYIRWLFHKSKTIDEEALFKSKEYQMFQDLFLTHDTIRNSNNDKIISDEAKVHAFLSGYFESESERIPRFIFDLILFLAFILSVFVIIYYYFKYFYYYLSISLMCIVALILVLIWISTLIIYRGLSSYNKSISIFNYMDSIDDLYAKEGDK